MVYIDLFNWASNYQFTYTSADVTAFNNEYEKYYNYRPFTETAINPDQEQMTNVNINTDDIKHYLTYAEDAYNQKPFGQLISNGNSQAVIYDEDDEIIVAFRGTETNPLEMFADIFNDTTTKIKLASDLGWAGLTDQNEDVMVMTGFNDYVDEIYHDILSVILKPSSIGKDLYIVGHSLGSISSQIFAYRLHLEAKFQNLPVHIHTVWGYGGVKGIYSPTNNIDNILNIISVNHYKDPVPYWFPIFGDSLGTKIILRGYGDYDVYNKNELTPYLGISIGNSNKYFQKLIEQPDYENRWLSNWMPALLQDMIDLSEFTSDLIGATIKYPQGRYSSAITKAGDIRNHVFETGYIPAIESLEPSYMISRKKSDIDDIQITQPDPELVFDSVFFSENEPINSINSIQNQPPKILGYVMNYNESMNHKQVAF